MTKTQMAELIEELRTAIQSALEEIDDHSDAVRCIDRIDEILREALRVEVEATRGGQLLTV